MGSLEQPLKQHLSILPYYMALKMQVLRIIRRFIVTVILLKSSLVWKEATIIS